MTAYVALVAIGNVLMGMMLARYLSPSATFPEPASPGTRTVESQRSPLIVPILPTVEAQQVSATGAGPTNRSQPNATNKSESEKNKPSHVAPTFVKSWADFAEQLRGLKERTQFCRPAQNMHLARQAAEQLRACAQVWYTQFESCLSGDKMDEGAQALVAGAEISDIEMFAAQIETTLTNIDALDWKGSVDEVLNSLERELDLLDGQQKRVSNKVRPIAVKA